MALNDLAGALGDIAADYRVIGGHTVTMLAARQLGAGLYRETGDVDLGIPPIVARDRRIADRLRDISYLQVAGNRFARELSDIPAGTTGKSDPPSREALIDILVPAYTSRARENVQVGEDLFTTEVPGLQFALARQPVTIALELRRLNGQTLRCELPFADELSALVLKSPATRARSKDTDVADTWRCLEIAFAAGLEPADFASGVRADSAAVIRDLFGSRLTTRFGPSQISPEVGLNLARMAKRAFRPAQGCRWRVRSASSAARAVSFATTAWRPSSGSAPDGEAGQFQVPDDGADGLRGVGGVRVLIRHAYHAPARPGLPSSRWKSAGSEVTTHHGRVPNFFAWAV